MSAITYLSRFENDCLNLYKTLESNTGNPELKELYELLADSRQRHLDALLHRQETVGSGDYESDLIERAEQVTNSCRQTLLAHDISKALRHDHDAFDHVVHAEGEMIRLCAGMAGNEKNEKVKELLSWFVADEKQHLEEIEGIYEFVEAPHCYLEWGEFSNLRTL
jgi:rubrerythrin